MKVTEDVSARLAAIFVALPDFELDCALRIVCDVIALRRGVSPREVLDEFFKTSWTDEEWDVIVRPKLEAIFGAAGDR